MKRVINITDFHTTTRTDGQYQKKQKIQKHMV